MEHLGPGPTQLERVFIETEFPIADQSPDHLQPFGTAHDSSRNTRFNSKLYRIFAGLARPLRVLDLGCSGGGFVRDCIDDGCIGVGIEGSDYSMRMARAEWGVLGGRFLFTADITKPFRVKAVWSSATEPLSFDVITAWEVFEHIARKDLAPLCANIRDHLDPSGLAILSISPLPHVINGVELHQTVERREWWLGMFRGSGLYQQDQFIPYFRGQYIRGPRQNTPGSFNLVLATTVRSELQVPSLSRRNRILDSWYGSRPLGLLRKLLNIEPTRDTPQHRAFCGRSSSSTEPYLVGRRQRRWRA